mmetsp:Transcript_67744/g.189054  ORF Transcript_67744/g.189054 Transcript_67744/m.189054 type:complete len:263 (-) Transcript_67744:458-1246(-)
MRKPVVYDDDVWAVEVRRLQHQVRLLNVAMHHRVLVQESEPFETLLEDEPPPLLGHLYIVLCSPLRELLKVTPEVRFGDQVIRLFVLEKLEGFRNPFIRQVVHGVELFLELIWPMQVQLPFGDALYTTLLARAIPRELQNTKSAVAQLNILGDLVPSIHQGFVRDGRLEHVWPKPLQVPSKMVFGKSVTIRLLEQPVAAEVKASILVAKVAEGVFGHVYSASQVGSEGTESRQVQPALSGRGFIEALFSDFFEREVGPRKLD